jgi:hypothetical protein
LTDAMVSIEGENAGRDPGSKFQKSRAAKWGIGGQPLATLATEPVKDLAAGRKAA